MKKRNLIKKVGDMHFTFDKTKLICMDKNNKVIFSKKITNGMIIELIIYSTKKLIIVLAWPSDKILNNEYMDDSLMAFDTNGKKVWSAELPVKNNLRHYTSLATENDKLYAVDNVEYKCQINPRNGKIIKKVLTK